MTASEFINSLICIIKQEGGSILLILAIVLSFVQISPIKIEPWSIILGWIGKKINRDVYARLDSIEKTLSGHIQESQDEKLEGTRSMILNFGTSCMRGEGHTKEEFDFIISKCDKYERHCIEDKRPNGVATATINQIRKLYDYNIMHNTFLSETADVH